MGWLKKSVACTCSHTHKLNSVDCWTSQVNQSVQTYTVSWQRHSVCFHVLITCKVTPSNIEI